MTEENDIRYRSDFKELPSEERPRERLMAYGPSTLSTAELLAILLSTGFTGKSVTSVAQDMLRDFGGLSGLLRADYTDLKRVKGSFLSHGARNTDYVRTSSCTKFSHVRVHQRVDAAVHPF